jgi:hypothetical protein
MVGKYASNGGFMQKEGRGSQRPQEFCNLRSNPWSELDAPCYMYRYIPESSRSLKLIQKNKVMEMGSSRIFID